MNAHVHFSVFWILTLYSWDKRDSYFSTHIITETSDYISFTYDEKQEIFKTSQSQSTFCYTPYINKLYYLFLICKAKFILFPTFPEFIFWVKIFISDLLNNSKNI